MMKIEIAKSNLQPALDACCTVVDAKSATPIASAVRIDAAMGTVTLRTTNLLQSVERTAQAVAIDSPGTVVVDATGLQRRIAALDDGPITIIETKGGIDVKQGTSRLTVGKYDQIEAPPGPARPKPGAEIDAKAFASLLKRLAPTMYENEALAHVYAVNIVASEGKMRAMATDSRSGALAFVTYDGDIEVLIPAPAVNQLIKVLGKIGGTVRLAREGSRFYVFGEGIVYSTLIALGQFPDMMSAVPAREGPALRANRESMLAALKLVEIVGLEDDRVHMRGTVEGVLFRGRSKEGSSASRAIDGTCEIQSSASVKYAIKMLEFIGGENVTMWQQDAGPRDAKGAPGGLVTENDNGDLYVVMPLRYDAEDLSESVPE